MNLGRVQAVAWKEALQILRDPRSLALAIAIPMLLLLLFGYALSLDVDRVPLIVTDRDQSNASRDLLLDFSGSPFFRIVGSADDDAEAIRAIDEGRAMTALEIPQDFSKKLGEGVASPVQLVVDGSDSQTATIAAGYATSVAADYNRTLTATHVAPPMELRPRVWFNEDLRSRNFIIPGLIAVIMMIITALITSLTVAREWERGTMEQLVATPVTARELLAGKFLPYFAIGFADMLLAVFLGKFLFHVPFRGSLMLLFGVSAIFLTGALCLGLCISVLARNQLLASQVAIITTFLPAFLLSGYVFAISNMPRAIQLVTYLVPARYFITVLRGIALKGVGLAVLAWEIILLTLFAVAMVLIAARAFHKRVA